jgi:hypothetical protein
VEIWYVLVGYASSWGQSSCSSINPPPNAGNWVAGNNNKDCYSEGSPLSSTAIESVTNLAHLSISGSAAFGNSNDEVVVCDSSLSQCWSWSNNDNVLNLYQKWNVAETGIFGYGGGSQAQFIGSSNSASFNVLLNEETGSGAVISPLCQSQSSGATGETNSLALVSGSCTTSPAGTMSFQELGYHLTMGTSGCCGTVSPVSGYYFGGPVTIKATANSGFYFTGWTGSGSGSYTGITNPQTITLGGPVTETAGFTRCCLP